MAIAVYFHPEAMSAAQYERVMGRLELANLDHPSGRLHHSAFGSPDHLMVYDVWDTQESFDAFGEKLMPLLAELKVDAGKPEIMPVHNMIQLLRSTRED
jgi:hypothetical protein